MSGQVDLEVSYWGLLLKYGNARATLVRLHDDAASLEARQAGVRASLGRGQLLPSSMAEVMTVRWAFDESMRVAQAASALRRQLHALSLVVRYQCLAFADECYSPDHMPSCGEDFYCLSNALARISAMSACCSDQVEGERD